MNHKTVQTHHASYGTTLTELLVYIALLSTVMIIITTFLVDLFQANMESRTAISIEQDEHFILQRLIYDIQRADSITVPANLGDTNSTLTLNIEGENFNYQLTAGNLQLTNDNGTFDLNSTQTNITSTSFKKIGNPGGKDMVQINIDLESVAEPQKGKESKTIQTSVAIR